MHARAVGPAAAAPPEEMRRSLGWGAQPAARGAVPALRVAAAHGRPLLLLLRTTPRRPGPRVASCGREHSAPCAAASSDAGASSADYEPQRTSQAAAPEHRSYSDYYRTHNTPYVKTQNRRLEDEAPEQPGHVAHVNSHTQNSSRQQDSAGGVNLSVEPSADNGADARGDDTVMDSNNGDSSFTGAGRREVDRVVNNARAAARSAEGRLSDLQKFGGQLDPLQPPFWLKALRGLRSVIVVAALSGLLVASNAFGLWSQWAAALLGAVGIALWGYKKSALSQSGAFAAAVVGAGTLGCSLRFGATLLAFFFSSSKLTQYKEEVRQNMVDNYKRGGQRDWVQVFCNGFIPMVLAVAYGFMAGCVDVPLGALPNVESWRADIITLIMGAFMGYYACCCGDTWASEVGTLSKDTPRLIVGFRPVRKGTNGGITLLGMSASLAGGLCIGLVFYLAALASPTLWIFPSQRAVAAGQWKLIPLGLMAGMTGSLIDSVIGATLQYTGYDPKAERIVSEPRPGVLHISGLPLLSNDLVNLISASMTAVITALVALRAFG